MAPLHPSDSHTQTHTAVIIIKPNCKTSLAACQSEPVPNQPSCGSNTHRQVRRTCWTEPRLSSLGFFWSILSRSPALCSVSSLSSFDSGYFSPFCLQPRVADLLFLNPSLSWGWHQDVNLVSLPGPGGLEKRGWGGVCSQKEDVEEYSGQRQQVDAAASPKGFSAENKFALS